MVIVPDEEIAALAADGRLAFGEVFSNGAQWRAVGTPSSGFSRAVFRTPSGVWIELSRVPRVGDIDVMNLLDQC